MSVPAGRGRLDWPASVANHLGELESLTLAAAAEQANQIASTFTKLRNYVYQKKLFRKNGLAVRIGEVDVQLSLYVGRLPRIPMAMGRTLTACGAYGHMAWVGPLPSPMTPAPLGAPLSP